MRIQFSNSSAAARRRAFAIPRRNAPEVWQELRPEKSEGAGNAGRPTRPQPRVQNKKAHERSHHGHTGNHPAFPAQWFYGLLRALPGDQACLTPSPALLIADLPPASGRQNHTTSPSVSARSSHALPASTASRPTSVTCARPSEGRDRIAIVLICPWRQAGFLKFRNRSGVAPIPNRSIGDLNEIADRRHPEVPERSGGLEGRRRRDVPVTILRGA